MSSLVKIATAGLLMALTSPAAHAAVTYINADQNISVNTDSVVYTDKDHSVLVPLLTSEGIQLGIMAASTKFSAVEVPDGNSTCVILKRNGHYRQLFLWVNESYEMKLCQNRVIWNNDGKNEALNPTNPADLKEVLGILSEYFLEKRFK